MWTPLILICMIGSPDCAIPAAPTYLSREECRIALDDALARMTLPTNLYVAAATCHAWGAGT